MKDNLPCYIDFRDYSARYKFIRKGKDSILGDIQLYKDTQYNKTVLTKERLFKTQEELTNAVQQCDILSNTNDAYGAVKFIGYTYKHNRTVTPNVYQFITLREYNDFDLEREMANRLRNKVYTHSPILLM